MKIVTLNNGNRSICFETFEELIKYKNENNIEKILSSECINSNNCRGICSICDSFQQKR